MTNIIVILFFIIFFSCAPIMVNRSFSDEMNRDKQNFFIPDGNFEYTIGDSGKFQKYVNDVVERSPYTENERNEYRLINSKGKNSMNPEKRKAKSRRPLFQNSRSLSRGSEKKETNSFFYSFSDVNELYVGMAKSSVMETWGRPHKVDVAGGRRGESERWTFYRRGHLNYVYFNKKGVEGWVLE